LGDLPVITGPHLIALLLKDRWAAGRTNSHGQLMSKKVDAEIRTTVIPTKRKDLTPGTLSAILGAKQTGIGRDGLAALIEKHGL